MRVQTGLSRHGVRLLGVLVSRISVHQKLLLEIVQIVYSFFLLLSNLDSRLVPLLLDICTDYGIIPTLVSVTFGSIISMIWGGTVPGMGTWRIAPVCREVTFGTSRPAETGQLQLSGCSTTGFSFFERR